MERVRGILLHISVVCSLICITTKILDYYNPYMDFSGNTVGFQFVLYVAVIALAVTRTVIATVFYPKATGLASP